LSTVKIVHKRQ